jgi:hypothetical protein
VLEEALSWHVRCGATGSMLPEQATGAEAERETS